MITVDPISDQELEELRKLVDQSVMTDPKYNVMSCGYYYQINWLELPKEKVSVVENIVVAIKSVSQ